MAREGLVRVTTMRQAEGRRPHITHVWKRALCPKHQYDYDVPKPYNRADVARDIFKAAFGSMLRGEFDNNALDSMRAFASKQPAINDFPLPSDMFPIRSDAKRIYHFERARFYAAYPSALQNGVEYFITKLLTDFLSSKYLLNDVSDVSYASSLSEVYSRLLMGDAPEDYESVVRAGTDPVVAYPHPRLYSAYVAILLRWANRDAYQYTLAYELYRSLKNAWYNHRRATGDASGFFESVGSHFRRLDEALGERVSDAWARVLAGDYYRIRWDRVTMPAGSSDFEREPFINEIARRVFGKPMEYVMSNYDFLPMQHRI